MGDAFDPNPNGFMLSSLPVAGIFEDYFTELIRKVSVEASFLKPWKLAHLLLPPGVKPCSYCAW